MYLRKIRGYWNPSRFMTEREDGATRCAQHFVRHAFVKGPDSNTSVSA